MSLAQSMEGSVSESMLLTDYQFALKCFINKDIARSFSLVSKLQPATYRSFNQNSTSEDTFVKVTTLYLTMVGLLLKPQRISEAFQLNVHDKQKLVRSLRQNDIFDQITDIYGSIEEAPSELIFQLFLVYYTCQDTIQGENEDSVLQKFIQLYHRLEFKERQEDRYLKRWFDLFVLNVLPEADDFVTAYGIAEKNETFGGSSMVNKLKEIEETKKREKSTKEKEKKEAQAREAKRIAAEKERQKKEAHEKSLKFRSLNQIRAEQEARDSPKNMENPSVSVPSLAQVKDRLTYFYNLTKNVLRDNSPVILVVLVLLVISGHTVRKHKVDLKQKFKDTLSMAFKVTYL